MVRVSRVVCSSFGVTRNNLEGLAQMTDCHRLTGSSSFASRGPPVLLLFDRAPHKQVAPPQSVFSSQTFTPPAPREEPVPVFPGSRKKRGTAGFFESSFGSSFSVSSSPIPAQSTSSNDADEPAADGAYPVADGSEGAGMFVEYSVESVREALRRKNRSSEARKTAAATSQSSALGTGYCVQKGNMRAGTCAVGNAETTRKDKRRRKTLFQSMEDAELAVVTPDDLSTQQLLYVLGRACILASAPMNHLAGNEDSDVRILPPEQWRALFRSLRRRILELDPMEITRACQGLAYANRIIDAVSRRHATGCAFASEREAVGEGSGWWVAKAECGAAFAELQRHVATHIHLLHGDCLSRVIYATLKGGFHESVGFVEFVCSEVLSRLNSLRPWHVFRIFQSSVSSAENVGQDFIVSLAQHLVKNLAFLPAESIGTLIPSLVKLKIFESSSNLAKLNVIAGKRFRGLSESTLLVTLGEPLLSYGLLTPVNVVALLKGLIRTNAPTSYPVPLSSSFDESLPSWHTACVVLHKVNKVLLPLKRMEMQIRHGHQQLFENLSPPIRSFLDKVRHAKLKLSSFAPPLEQQHVNAPLLRVASALYYLHPSLYGPFLLELSDPLSRVAVEWDTPWLLFPPWNQFSQRTFGEQRHRHLRDEGWQLILLPLRPFLEAKTEAARERYIRSAS
ncbi:uncharacterized protein LOC34619377 [Cyclospora cayetanensis]|uniref:Uncharacterized protein LOC34619377 n=1 Tax=Cyclospora cayetanensis TaxID=88456 RepID=A0A6P6RXD2_9EIME|nr:uncharacterized protein LOC34619377 [Cyclospora cayetanensis]